LLVDNNETMSSLSTLFCNVCGTLLKYGSDLGNVKCSLCNTESDFSKDTLNTERKTCSTRRSKLKGRRREEISRCQLIAEDKGEENRPTVAEKCEKCGNNEMYFSTAQLRSADEGQTVFYECTRCRYKFSLNS